MTDQAGRAVLQKRLFAVATIRGAHATCECGLAAEGPVTFDSCRGCCTAAIGRDVPRAAISPVIYSITSSAVASSDGGT